MMPDTGAKGAHDAGALAAGFGVHSSGPAALHPTARRILGAARTLLLERGYQGMTLQAIADEAQVNKAGVWYYFGGKQQMVFALLEDITVGESQNFGSLPPEEATLEERVSLLVGTEDELRARVRRFRAIYELLPETSRDQDLGRQLRLYYDGWYEWAAAVLAPAVDGRNAPTAGETGRAGDGATVGEVRPSVALGQFASFLLDGIIMQMVVGATGFDLTAALTNARRSLLLAAAS
jgi:AcrR family transcriptional regulator